MIVTLSRSCMSASFGGASLGLHLQGIPRSSPSFPAVEKSKFLPGTITAVTTTTSAAYASAGGLLRGGGGLQFGPSPFSGMQLSMAGVRSGLCTENTLRSLRVVPSSQSWHQTGTNRKGQASPSSQWRHSCVSSSPVLPGSLPISHIVNHRCCGIALRYCCALVSLLLLSLALFLQDCSIWLHCNL